MVCVAELLKEFTALLGHHVSPFNLLRQVNVLQASLCWREDTHAWRFRGVLLAEFVAKGIFYLARRALQVVEHDEEEGTSTVWGGEVGGDEEVEEVDVPVEVRPRQGLGQLGVRK